MLLTVSIALGEVKSTMIINFAPEIEGEIPYVMLEPNPEMKDNQDSPITITAYALEGAEEVILATKEISSGDKLKYVLPTRNKREILGVKIEDESKSIAEWRTIFNNGKSVLDYKGVENYPADLKEYWDRTKEELSKIPMNAEIIPVPEKTTETGNLYKIKLNSFNNIPIISWYYVPKDIDMKAEASKKYPAIQIMPGWGAEEPPLDRTNQGLITLSLNPRTHGPSKEFFTTPIESHHLWNIDDPDNYYYRAAYMDCLRGIEFLMSRPEVNHDKVGVEGGSQGGAFTLAMAALDNRLACAVANVPYLSYFPDFIKLATKGSGTTFGKYLNDPEKGKRVKQTLDYIDVSNLAPWIKCPTMVCVGLQDRVCPPLTGIIDYNRISDDIPKQLLMDPKADHEVTKLMRDRNMEWYKKYLLE